MYVESRHLRPTPHHVVRERRAGGRRIRQSGARLRLIKQTVLFDGRYARYHPGCASRSDIVGECARFFTMKTASAVGAAPRWRAIAAHLLLVLGDCASRIRAEESAASAGASARR